MAMIGQRVRIILLLTASILCFAIYYSMWIDWIHGFTDGTFGNNYLVALGKTTALSIYTVFAVRFAYQRINTLL
ncbi:hypothetical protein A6C57_08530 [Fibrella sp. ES10-3-2-2]|nr:hypothetical protein A6C57_08530 [Fibrella sp. ES10-3-2-2]